MSYRLSAARQAMVLLAGLTLTLSGCTASAPTAAPQSGHGTALTTSATTPVPKPDHIVVVMEENHSYSDVIGSSSAPYINSLAGKGASFSQSFAIAHPSQPNYLALFSGSPQGITSDSCPHTFSADNLGHQLATAGSTFTGYSESLPSAGYTGCTSGDYARKHSPWVNFSDVPAAANQPFTAFPSTYASLPTLSFVIPNLRNDMHDGSVSTGDAWLKTNLAAYATWATTHNSLLVVTWDEDDNSSNNQIATIVAGARVKAGTYSEHITHYNLLRTLENAYGLSALGSAATAAPITDIWTAS